MLVPVLLLLPLLSTVTASPHSAHVAGATTLAPSTSAECQAALANTEAEKTAKVEATNACYVALPAIKAILDSLTPGPCPVMRLRDANYTEQAHKLEHCIFNGTGQLNSDGSYNTTKLQEVIKIKVSGKSFEQNVLKGIAGCGTVSGLLVKPYVNCILTFCHTGKPPKKPMSECQKTIRAKTLAEKIAKREAQKECIIQLNLTSLLASLPPANCPVMQLRVNNYPEKSKQLDICNKKGQGLMTADGSYNVTKITDSIKGKVSGKSFEANTLKGIANCGDSDIQLNAYMRCIFSFCETGKAPPSRFDGKSQCEIALMKSTAEIKEKQKHQAHCIAMTEGLADLLKTLPPGNCPVMRLRVNGHPEKAKSLTLCTMKGTGEIKADGTYNLTKLQESIKSKVSGKDVEANVTLGFANCGTVTGTSSGPYQRCIRSYCETGAPPPPKNCREALRTSDAEKKSVADATTKCISQFQSLIASVTSSTNPVFTLNDLAKKMNKCILTESGQLNANGSYNTSKLQQSIKDKVKGTKFEENTDLGIKNCGSVVGYNINRYMRCIRTYCTKGASS